MGSDERARTQTVSRDVPNFKEIKSVGTRSFFLTLEINRNSNRDITVMPLPSWCYSLGSLPFLHCECAMFGGENGGNGAVVVMQCNKSWPTACFSPDNC